MNTKHQAVRAQGLKLWLLQRRSVGTISNTLLPPGEGLGMREGFFRQGMQEATLERHAICSHAGAWERSKDECLALKRGRYQKGRRGGSRTAPTRVENAQGGVFHTLRKLHATRVYGVLEESLLFLGLCFLCFQPQGADDGKEDGGDDAKNPGQVPHRDIPFSQ